MKDEELALKLVEIYYIKNKTIIDKEGYWDLYFYFLEKIKNYKSETLKGKIEYELKDFDETTYRGIAPIDCDRFVKKIRKIVENN